jgi:hypothetical protein
LEGSQDRPWRKKTTHDFQRTIHDEKGSGVAKAMPDRHVMLIVDR